MGDGIAKMQAKLIAMGKAPYAGLKLAAIKVAQELRSKVNKGRKAKTKHARAAHKASGKGGKFVKPKGSGVPIAVVTKGDDVSVTASTQCHKVAKEQNEPADWVDITADAVVQEVSKALQQ